MMIDGNTAVNLTTHEATQLNGGRRYVFEVMRSGQWMTIQEVQSEVFKRWGAFFTESCISARIRDMRKWEYGNHTVNRQQRCGRLYEYQLEANKQ
jgi:hypothetical protein